MPSTGRLRRETAELGGLATGRVATKVMELSLEYAREAQLKDSHDGKVKARQLARSLPRSQLMHCHRADGDCGC